MAIQTVNVITVRRAQIFKPSALATQYCQGEGLEIGAAAHNPFNLPGARNVAISDYPGGQQAQIDMCGSYAKIDIDADTVAIPVDDDSQDYVLSSHVLEHLIDPIKAIKEWVRVTKPSGIIFLIVPHRDALPNAAARPVSLLDQLKEAHENGYDYDNHPEEWAALAGNKHGHWWVFDMGLLNQLFGYLSGVLPLSIVYSAAKDDKVGNGYLHVLRVGAKEVKAEVPVELATEEVEVPVAEEGAVVEEAPKPPKKPRGRPRKAKAKPKAATVKKPPKIEEPDTEVE
jgi:SAM-dependent methyltransferase